MPENETLLYDARSANRWRPVGERLDNGQAPTDLFPEIQNHFYTAMQKAWRQWRDRGVDPCKLFNAALTDPKLLRELIKKLAFDKNAQLLRDVAADVKDADMEQIIDAFVNAAWGDVENQLGLDRRYEALSQEFVGQVHRMLSRIVRSLTNNPSRFPNRPSRKNAPPDLDAQLGESLL